MPPLSQRPEHELLLCCARTRLSAETRERIHTLTQTALDWDLVFETAAIQGIAALVRRALDAVAPTAVPATIRERLDVRLHASAMQSRFLAEQLAPLARLIESESLRALYFKGPTLASAIYGDLSLREFHDLDVLVAPQDFQRTSTLLQAHGYVLRADHGWQVMLVRAPVHIDLHRAISAPSYPIPMDFDRWWRRRTFFDIAGVRIPTLSPEDLLVLLCIQAARDVWGWTLHLEKICDIAETATVTTGLDWHAIETEASRLHVRWIVAFGLQLAVRALGVALPEAAARAAAPSRSVRQLVDQECAGLFDAAGDGHGRRRHAEFHVGVRERIRDRAWPYWMRRGGLSWRPNAHDRTFVALPRWLSALYYVIRPFRLLWRHGMPSLIGRLSGRSPRLDKP